MSKSKKAIKYAIDNGLISVDLATGDIIGVRGKVLKPGLSDGKYYAVNIPTPDGKQVSVQSHRIIGYVKFGNAALQDGAQIDHWDRNKLNNCPDNLRLTDAMGNAQNHELYGLDAWKSETIEVRRDIAIEVRNSYIENLYTPKELAEIYEVSYNTVLSILRGGSLLYPFENILGFMGSSY